MNATGGARGIFYPNPAGAVGISPATLMRWQKLPELVLHGTSGKAKGSELRTTNYCLIEAEWQRSAKETRMRIPDSV